MDPKAVFGEAARLHQAGRLAEAAALYDQILAHFPTHPDTLQLRGVVDLQQGRLDAAVGRFDRALAAKPDHAGAHANRAAALIALGRYDDALVSAGQAVALAPASLAAAHNLVSVFNSLGRPADALKAADAAQARGLDDAKLQFYRAEALIDLARWDDALAACDRAIALNPALPEAHGARAHALTHLQRLTEAAAAHERALAMAPNSPEGHYSHAVALQFNREHMKAIESCSRALALRPDFMDAFLVRAAAYEALGRYEDAISDCDSALNLNPESAQGFALRATCYKAARKPELALADFEAALDLDPDIELVPGQAVHLALQVCEWDGIDKKIADLLAAVDRGQYAVQPLVLAALPATPRQQHLLAMRCHQATFPGPRRDVQAVRSFGDKIRIGYFSTDLGDHPVGHLIVGLLEAHDRSQFEIVSFSFGSDVKDATRARIEKASDTFVEALGMPARDIAALAREMNVHIAVDLNGYTANMRPEIFNEGAAPLQVNYLGYPGTLGSDRIAYIIGDPTITPPEHAPHYSERIVTMPHSYLVTNDIKRHVPARVSTRRELGVPETGFAFCCFNATHKITPDVFEVWMRLLQGVDGSFLWLNDPGPTGLRNMRREAKARGVAPDRLVFAPRTPGLEYLARYRAADLFLDTFYYNAHATGCEALMMGVPVVTRLGEAFPGRVGAGLLTSLGLPELIATDSAGYERIALDLARDPAALAAIRAKLARHAASYPLFDTKRYTRNLESAYREMWRRHEDGLAPDHITVVDKGAA